MSEESAAHVSEESAAHVSGEESRDVLTRPSPPPDLTRAYGPDPDQVVDLRLPRGDAPAGVSPERPPLIVVIHGGFWRDAYDRAHIGSMAAALADAGYAVAVPEYRRTGRCGGDGGWPGTFDDIAAVLDALPALFTERIRPGPAVLVGHSAGGHLALWAAGRHRLDPRSRWYAPAVDDAAATAPGEDAAHDTTIAGVVALAPVSDLTEAHRADLDGGAVTALLGGPPEQWPERYAAADPSRLVPLGVPTILVHGDADRRVPVEMSRMYTAKARAAGDPVELIELPGTDHFAVIDPQSTIWSRVRRAIDAVAIGADQ